jgi:stage II sporulation protein AB (anti-sigma F factor)
MWGSSGGVEQITVIPEPRRETRRIERRAPAVPRSVAPLRRAVAALAREAGFDADQVDDISLAVSEVLTNVVMHAYEDGVRGDVELAAESDAQGLSVDVADAGTGFRRRTDSPGLGLGLALAAGVASDLRITPRRPGGTVVSLRFEL